MAIPTQLAVRAFVVDRTTKTPVSGLPIVAETQIEKGPMIPMGTLVSDTNGYVSFKTNLAEIDRLTTRDTISNIHIYPKGFPELKEDVLPFLGQTEGRGAYSYAVASEDLKLLRSSTLHSASARPAVVRPDLDDIDISPGSVITNGSVHLGQGDCSALVPTTMAKREYPFRQILISDRVLRFLL